MSYFRRPLGQDDTTPSVDLSPQIPETGDLKTSSTTQDTTVLPGGAVVGGQDTGVPTTSLAAWKNIGGVCYPTNTPQGITLLGQLKELQRQLNRVADNQGWAKIGIDGQVGPQTLGLLTKVSGPANFAGVMSNPDISHCDNVCYAANLFIAAVQAYADSLNAPSSVSSPAGNPVLADQAGHLTDQPVADSLLDKWNNLSSTNKLLVLAGIGGIGYYAYTEYQKRGGK